MDANQLTVQAVWQNGRQAGVCLECQHCGWTETRRFGDVKPYAITWLAALLAKAEEHWRDCHRRSARKRRSRADVIEDYRFLVEHGEHDLDKIAARLRLTTGTLRKYLNREGIYFGPRRRP